MIKDKEKEFIIIIMVIYIMGIGKIIKKMVLEYYIKQIKIIFLEDFFKIISKMVMVNMK